MVLRCGCPLATHVFLCRFVQQFDGLLQRVHESSTSLNVAVVGGGAGGVELALALAYRLKQERSKGSTNNVDNDASVVQQDTVRSAVVPRCAASHPGSISNKCSSQHPMHQEQSKESSCRTEAASVEV